MHLLRIKIENWRGIDAREVRFTEGVTLIEGPNEAGKSTLVEALRCLIREQDSSGKKDIKAIQPVGHDVGSRIEAEIQSGGYHFVYAKTYNKSKQTTLHQLAPDNKQLTGRDAHDYATQILGETVDLALWEALLVNQGEKIAPAELNRSAGLAAALDKVAGSGGAEGEDQALLDAVTAEYLNYFTQTGRSRTGPDEARLQEAEQKCDAAAAELERVEQDATEHERLAAELRAHRERLPGLQQVAETHEQEWSRIAELQGQRELTKRDLVVAQQEQKAAEKALKERSELLEHIASDEKTLEAAKGDIEPLQEAATAAKKKLSNAELVIKDLKKKLEEARARDTLARADEAHLVILDDLQKQQQRREALTRIERDIATALDKVGKIRIDGKGLEAMREAESRLRIVTEKRDMAATSLVVRAHSPLQLKFGEETISLPQDERLSRTIASAVDIDLPGVATLSITPPQSAGDLEAELKGANETLAELKKRHGVATLAEAIEQFEAKQACDEELRRLKDKRTAQAGEETAAEIDQAIARLDADRDAYLASRPSKAGLPATLQEARQASAASRDDRHGAEQAVEDAEGKAEQFRKEASEADQALRAADEGRIQAGARLDSLMQRLAGLRNEMSDADLQAETEKKAAIAAAQQRGVDEIEASLNALNADAVSALRDNAREAIKRAERDLQATEQALAIVGDRLRQSQADGRYEALEVAKAQLERTQAEVESIRRRAAAAQRLWETLTKHRDAARQAYVLPLKEAIERLGRIVFGADFEVTLNDDWSLASRTSGAKTLPYEALSIGAQEQLCILARLAAAQIVSKDGGVPLIIDDALGFSDPSRLERMGAAISEAGKLCQVIILTCTPGRFAHVGSASTIKF